METIIATLRWSSGPRIQDIFTDKVLFCQKADGQNGISAFPLFSAFSADQSFKIQSFGHDPLKKFLIFMSFFTETVVQPLGFSQKHMYTEYHDAKAEGR